MTVWAILFCQGFRKDRHKINGYLEKLSFHPSSALRSKFYPRNIDYMPAVKF